MRSTSLRSCRAPRKRSMNVMLASSSARIAIEHLLSLGHRRIAAITGPASWVASVDRLAGFHSALQSAGLAPEAEHVREADFLLEGGYHAASELLSLARPPTAIFAFNDNMAIGA